MRQAAYATIAYALRQRDMAARNQARQKVHQIAGDLAEVFAHEDPAFNSADFFRACGFTGDDIAAINDQMREVPFSMLARSAADPGENEGHQGYANYETFVIGEWIKNDRGITSEALGVAEEAGAGEEYPDVCAAEALRAWVEENHLTEKPGADAEALMSGIANSLMNSVLGEVDFLQLARRLLGMEDD